MPNLLKFKAVDDEKDVLRIGGKSFLPSDIEWPQNPNGEKLTFIINLPTNFLNKTLGFHYPKDKAISVFTTYNQEDYFLDVITYHGDTEELQNIKNGFTKVILHTIDTPRNDSDFLVPAHEILIDEKIDKADCGSFLGGNPVFLQNEKMELELYRFCMQLYGGDFPEEFQDVFYLEDSIGYLFLNKEDVNDIGLFFTQCT